MPTPAKLAALAVLLYLFFLSIGTLEAAFKGFGSGFSKGLFQLTSNEFVGLFIGVLATSLVQSSSTTTSITVALVASGALDVRHAVPIIMGANIGTSVTNTLVSLGHITRPSEFRRAFAAATVHDFFNILTVILLLPVELATGYLRHVAGFLAGFISRGGGIEFTSPLKAILKPIVKAAEGGLEGPLGSVGAHVFLLVAGLALLFLSLLAIVKTMRTLMLARLEAFFNRVLGKAAFLGILVGMLATMAVQSSSITTSLLVPLAGAGIATLEVIFPITLGANIGTTITALLAAMAAGGEVRADAALAIALAHLLFNITGILLIYPIPRIRRIPLTLARRLAEHSCRARRYAFIYVVTVFFIVPLVMIAATNLSGILRLLGGGS